MTGEVESFTWEQGKYGVEIRDGYRMTALRHGLPWPAKTDALVGDKFALTLLNELGDARTDAATLLGAALFAGQQLKDIREEIRGLADSLDDHIIADEDERLAIYNQLVILWQSLAPAESSDPGSPGTFTRPEISRPQMGVQRVEAAALRKAADLAQDRFIEEQAGIGFARVRTDVLRKWADHLDAGGSWETIPR